MSTESPEPTTSTPSAEPADTQADEASQSSRSTTQNNSPIKIAVYLGLGAVAIYLSTWIGPLAFHVSFQGKMLAAREEVPGLVVWTPAEEVPATRADDWTFRKEGDFFIPVPPGSPEFTREDEAVVATFEEEGVVTYHRFPKGFLLDLLRKEGEVIGATIVADRSDSEVLRELLEETCENYELGWSQSRRALYGARILGKMRLWEEKSLRHFRFTAENSALAVVAAFDDGTAAIMVADDGGTLLVRLPKTSPDSWKTVPGNWLPKAG